MLRSSPFKCGSPQGRACVFVSQSQPAPDPMPGHPFYRFCETKIRTCLSNIEFRVAASIVFFARYLPICATKFPFGSLLGASELYATRDLKGGYYRAGPARSALSFTHSQC